jgi:hypothetical protein
MSSTTRARRQRQAVGGAVIAILGVLLGAVPAMGSPPAITYKTLFQDPGVAVVPDLSLEAHAISLIDATPPGAHIAFAFRDFNRQPVANALIAAHQ